MGKQSFDGRGSAAKSSESWCVFDHPTLPLPASSVFYLYLRQDDICIIGLDSRVVGLFLNSILLGLVLFYVECRTYKWLHSIILSPSRFP